MNWLKYQRLGTIYAYMHRLQLQYPHLVEVITIGRTDQGRDMLVAKIGKSHSGYPKKAIFIEAGLFQPKIDCPINYIMYICHLYISLNLKT